MNCQRRVPVGGSHVLNCTVRVLVYNILLFPLFLWCDFFPALPIPLGRPLGPHALIWYGPHMVFMHLINFLLFSGNSFVFPAF